MEQPYKEFKGLNLPAVADEIQAFWNDKKIFDRSVSEREGMDSFVFYEGPPSANGMPGIHHVMARTIKDIFCRYQTILGKQVHRKAGWDTHGLPIELAVEKTLGITKEDIGKKITVEEYNNACRKEVMKYTDKWEELTRVMGYWVDMSDPYITYDNKYIETVWWLLSQLYSKDLLYKGYTIQPYSPAAGTGLSSHEINQPGCYREVKDTSAVAMFQLSDHKFEVEGDIYALAWTTTPWTLPSNTALAVGEKISYVLLKSVHLHSNKIVHFILAKDLVSKYFADSQFELSFEDYKAGDKNVPVSVVLEIKGSDLKGLNYQQLLPFAQPADGDAFRIIAGDFVTTEDGTGIVHIAPSFGADDFRVARQNGIGSLTLVDKRGRFLPEVNDGTFLYGEEFVKEDYYSQEEKDRELLIQKEKLKRSNGGPIEDTSALKYLSVDERICLKLQQENKLFKKEKYSHNYPHCWRTDKPILYYPLDSWFIKIPQVRERMAELNNTIHWKPESTGTGRFGNWLENANDWNLSRSRYWGIPLPIWRSEDGSEVLCIGSVEQLKSEIEKSVKAGIMTHNPLSDFIPNDFSKENYNRFDLHKPYADDIILVSQSGKRLVRESDLIDVWFDSGAMPYAQLHYPFENKQLIDPDNSGKRRAFPADFIAEGVDQTRGWFYTLHAIATMCFDSVAYKNVISNGLVLDKNGNKMSKRLGNAVDPFTTIAKYGPDATRWYMITNAQPWDNLKFDEAGITEVQRKFFGTLYNTYGFFAIYANIDRFVMDFSNATPPEKRSELDRWIISRLNNLIATVTDRLNDFDPTPAARAVEEFVDLHLSNWYVRLSRKRFWHGELNLDKKAAYETLFECLLTVAQLSSPFAPFFADWIYRNLTSQMVGVSDSVHLAMLPKANADLIDFELEERMSFAQEISSMVLSIRKKENIRVRQPLQTIRIPIFNNKDQFRIQSVKDIILAETNVKQLEFVDESKAEIVKNLKLNFKTLGAKCGKNMKAVQSYAAAHNSEIIRAIEKHKRFVIDLEGVEIELLQEDVEIIPVDIPGWKVVNDGALTVALDVTISEELHREGIAREFVNRIQNLRKDLGFEVSDKIIVKIERRDAFNEAVEGNSEYIRAQILAEDIQLLEKVEGGQSVEIDDNTSTQILLAKLINFEQNGH